MRRPYWRAQTQHYYIKIHGKAHRLSKERYPDGDKRKTLPPAVENEWHRITREGVPSEIKLSEVFTRFKATCETAHHAKSTNYMLDQFAAFVGDPQAAKLRPFHLTDFLKSKTTWNPSTQRTAVNRRRLSLDDTYLGGVDSGQFSTPVHEVHHLGLPQAVPNR